MKIAVSASEKNIESEIDQRFGRCNYFVIVDSETMEFEALDNTGMTASGGAGAAAGQEMAKRGVEAVLTGNCGPNALAVLNAAGIKVATGMSGKIKDAVMAYVKGEIKENPGPNVSSHHDSGKKPPMVKD